MSEYIDLEDYLASEATSSDKTEQGIYAHFAQKCSTVPYRDDVLFVFDHERDFDRLNHLIQFHPRNSPTVPYHIYHYIVISYCYTGKMVFEIDGERLEIQAGDFLILDRHVPHKVFPTGPGDLGVNIILSDYFFSHRYINRVSKQRSYEQFMIELMNMDSKHIHYMLIHAQEDQLSRQCVDNILNERVINMEGSDDIIDSFIMILLTHLPRLEAYQTNLVFSLHKHRELVDEILVYIKRNYAQGNLNEACATIGYDVSYVSKLIKQITGHTFKELVNEERMKRSLALIQNKQIPIYEIAQSVGISNLTTFYKRFQHYTGKTPKQYRDEL